ncbi:MAG: magnesium-transporting ATPase, partial [Nostoc sp.]
LSVACAVCNDSVLQKEQGEWAILGDPTEGALLTLGGKAGIEKDQWNSKLPRVAEFPFSSERKRMSVIFQVQKVATGEAASRGVDPAIASLLQSEPYLMFTKGSPELILARSTQIHLGNHSTPLTEEQRQKILAENDLMASKGLRVLGFAYKPL